MNYSDVEDELEVLSIEDAAAECGMTIAEFLEVSGLVTVHPDGYTPNRGHPGLVPLEGREH